MKRKSNNKRGSITIIIMYIFLVILVFSSMTLTFAMLQASLSKNQLEKIRNRYACEDDLNQLVYEEDRISNYISEPIFKLYRFKHKASDGKYDIILDKKDPLKDNISKAYFTIEEINNKTNIILNIKNKNKNKVGGIIASGPCLDEVFNIKKSLWQENKLSVGEKEIFVDFIDKVQEENCDYDCKLDNKSMKINTDENIVIELESKISYGNEIFYKKKLSEVHSGSTKKLADFTLESLVVNLKKDGNESKSITIGKLGEESLIKLTGVLYIEGDLIVDQDFEFLGIIIINNGKIILNRSSKAKINGMLFIRGEDMDFDNLEVNYDQASLYKAGSFLPGFIDIKLDTIKRYY